MLGRTGGGVKCSYLAHDAEPTWNDGGLNAFGISGFNDTQLKPDAREILNIAAHRTIEADVLFSKGSEPISGRLIVEGTNCGTQQLGISLTARSQ